MSVFQISDHDGERIVEADSFDHAILAWQVAIAKENEGTDPADWIPESVTKINDEPVIRP